MAEPAYINPETIFNFHAIPATKLYDSESNTLVWDITVGNNQNEVAKIIFLTSVGLINVHCSKLLIVSKMLNQNHISQILVDSTESDTKSIFRFDGSSNLIFIYDGQLNFLDWHEQFEHHPWEIVNLQIQVVALLKAIHGNLPFQNDNLASHLNPGRFPFQIGGDSDDEDDYGNDSGNGGNDDGDGNGNGGNDGGNGNENGGNDGGNGNGNGGNDGGNGNENGGDGNGNAAGDTVTIHWLDVNLNYIEIISTNIVADLYANWYEFALAIFVVWLDNRNHDIDNAPALATVNPSTCWPGCAVCCGKVAADGSFDLYDWEHHEFEAVRMLLKDVIVIKTA